MEEKQNKTKLMEPKIKQILKELWITKMFVWLVNTLKHISTIGSTNVWRKDKLNSNGGVK